MTATSWKDIAELVGIVAIVASLLFVGLQLRQDRRVATLESLVAGQVTEFEVSRLIGENSDIWVRGLSDQELTRADKATFEAIANAVFRLYANDYRASLELGDSGETTLSSYAFFVYQYPGLRRKFYERAEAQTLRNRANEISWEVSPFVEMVDARLKQADANSAEVPAGNYVPL